MKLNIWCLGLIVGSILISQNVKAEETEVKSQKSEIRSQNIAQNLEQGEITRVTGVKVNQTTKGLELILQTVAGSERLVPLILPKGNDLGRCIPAG
jgi:hypothetical protein